MEDELSISNSGERSEQPNEKRCELLSQLEHALGRTVISYFTSQIHPVTIDQTDADMIEELFRQTHFQNGLCLLLDTPGGDAVAAERIVRICKIYSHNNYEVFVARRAKSAGTIITLGSKKIYMGETSALGCIDPQILVKEKNGVQTFFPAHIIITTFEELLKKAESSHHKEVFLQELNSYDFNQIEAIRRQFKMAEDIAVKCLKQGMMEKLSEEEIKDKVASFVTPVITKAHSRDIYFEDLQQVGLNIELVLHDNPIWRTVSDYYALAWDFVTSSHCKLVESVEKDFSLPWPDNKTNSG
jgi:ClpP class serine protease